MAKKKRIAINGFGRIGRSIFRLLLEHPTLEVVVINDLADSRTLSHLLKYDSIHGILHKDVSYDSKSILVEGKKYPLTNQADIKTISWEGFDVDIVLESTGKHKSRELLRNHLHCGVKKVLLSVPPKDDTIPMVVL